MRPLKVFTASWGELEAEGSNLGDGAILEAQLRDLKEMGAVSGLMAADPQRCARLHAGVRCFDTRRGRVRAMAAGVRWSDAVIVGGGELLQDRSSRLYSPFNLIPLYLARLFGRRSFCWAVGIGGPGELSRTTAAMARGILGRCAGITARDPSTFDTLVGWGLGPPKVITAADTALSLSRGRSAGPVGSDLLGAAPRNVLNRKGALLPLEVRRKLPGYRRDDPSPAASLWAGLLDGHLESRGGAVLLFPFHTGSLSNDDGDFCALVRERMVHRERASVASFETVDEALALLAGCRVVVTTPLHGAILSVVAGALPVAVPYSGKCARFMDSAGLSALCSPGSSGVPGPETREMLDDAWTRCTHWWEGLGEARAELTERAGRTADHFRARLGLC